MKAAASILAGALCVLSLWSYEAEAACTPPTCQKIIDNGPDSEKKVLVVIGDGYASGDQARWVDDANRLVIDGVFKRDFFNEDQNAFNVYRLDLVSAQSGVSRRVYDERGTSDGSDDIIVSTTMKDTALKYIYSGSWSHCWMEWSSETHARLTAALSMVPRYDFWLVVLNEDGWGGCGGGGGQTVTRGGDWSVVAHEYGHGIGGVGDEYWVGGTTYTGATANGVNCSNVVNRSSVYWNRFINPSTALPTAFTAGMDSNRTVGMFEGCGTVERGIYRPVDNCRMRGNSPAFCPVCYTHMKKQLYSFTAHDFDNATAGDFSGDGKADLLIHNGNDLALYRTDASGARLDDQAWFANNVVPAAPGAITWQPAPNDRYYVADFDGDGKKDVFVFNASDWSMPYLGMLRSDGNGLVSVARYDGSIPGFWGMAAGDQFHVGDFDGDGKAELAVHNTANWSMPYLGILRSTGTSLYGVARHDGTVPGWSMANHDQLFPGDFDGDGRTDIYIFNPDNWSYRYFAMLRSSGAGLSAVKVFTSSLPYWTLSASDQFYVGDFDGDGKADLYVFNGAGWSYTYLLMARSTGADLAYVARYDSSNDSVTNVPGWAMRKNDRFWVTDANSDGRADLFVFNPALDWGTEYLGTLLSSGYSLGGSWSADWVGGWNLGNADQILPADYDGVSGSSGLFIRNTQWLGMIRRSGSGFSQDKGYFKWIYNPQYDARPWSDSLP